MSSIVLRAVVEGLLRTSDGLVGEGHLATGHNVNGVQLADGLARGGHHAANAVHLVAKELHANGGRGLRGVHVHGVAVHVEGTRRGHVRGVRVAHAHQQARHVLKVHLVAHAEGAAGEVGRALGRHAAQQGAGAGHYQALLALGQTLHRAAAGAHHGVVRRLVGPGPVLALRVAAHHAPAQPGGQVAGGAVRRLLAGDYEQAGPGVARPQGRHHKGTRALGHGQCGVVSLVELVQKRQQLRRGQQAL